MECIICVCMGRRGWRGGCVDEKIGFGFANPVGTWEVLDVCTYFGYGGVGGTGGEWGRWLGPGSGGVDGVCVSMNYLCRWQVQVPVVHPVFNTAATYMGICFLTCICL